MHLILDKIIQLSQEFYAGVYMSMDDIAMIYMKKCSQMIKFNSIWIEKWINRKVISEHCKTLKLFMSHQKCTFWIPFNQKINRNWTTSAQDK